MPTYPNYMRGDELTFDRFDQRFYYNTIMSCLESQIMRSDILVLCVPGSATAVKIGQNQ